MTSKLRMVNTMDPRDLAELTRKYPWTLVYLALMFVAIAVARILEEIW